MKLVVSSHAAIRYMQRVRPSLEFDAAKAELEALLDIAGEPSSSPPGWVHDPHADTSWLHLSDGIVGACKREIITTILVRGASHPAHRKHKNKQKAQRRARRKKPPFKPGMGREAEIKWR